MRFRLSLSEMFPSRPSHRFPTLWPSPFPSERAHSSQSLLLSCSLPSTNSTSWRSSSEVQLISSSSSSLSANNPRTPRLGAGGGVVGRTRLRGGGVANRSFRRLLKSLSELSLSSPTGDESKAADRVRLFDEHATSTGAFGSDGGGGRTDETRDEEARRTGVRGGSRADAAVARRLLFPTVVCVDATARAIGTGAGDSLSPPERICWSRRHVDMRPVVVADTIPVSSRGGER